MHSFRRAVLAVVVVVGLSAPAFGQITWNVTFTDGPGVGFNDPTVDAGETLSRGQLRRDSVTAATDYLGRYLDGRAPSTSPSGRCSPAARRPRSTPASSATSSARSRTAGCTRRPCPTPARSPARTPPGSSTSPTGTTTSARPTPRTPPPST